MILNANGRPFEYEYNKLFREERGSMFISKIEISNYRLFGSNETFIIDNFNIPDGETEGSGVNVFVGENGTGKTTLLDAITLPLLEYKSDGFSLDDMNDPQEETRISVYSNKSFKVKGTMPRSDFDAHGFLFKALIRKRSANNYFSSIIVSDQLFIKTNPDKPADNSPDLRLSVNNPFIGKRFNENDVIFLDRNRYNQIKSGMFNQTRFDRMLEDLDYQYIKGSDSISDINNIISENVKKGNISNSFLNSTIKEFSDITGIPIKLDFISNYRPFKDAFFVQRRNNGQQIKVSNIGSGFEMLFSLIYSYQMTLQSNKQLIILIDEPELHMHPSLQQNLINFILKISSKAQVFLSTHSALFVKQLSGASAAKIMILQGLNQPTEMEVRKLPYLSANETNYLAFGLATAEYHNELYELLKSIHGEEKNYKQFDNEFFIQEKGEKKDSPWKKVQNEVSLNTYVRNQIHHTAENGSPLEKDLKESIDRMRGYL